MTSKPSKMSLENFILFSFAFYWKTYYQIMHHLMERVIIAFLNVQTFYLQAVKFFGHLP